MPDDDVRRVEVISGIAGCRYWPAQEKLCIVEKNLVLGESGFAEAKRNGMAPPWGRKPSPGVAGSSWRKSTSSTIACPSRNRPMGAACLRSDRQRKIDGWEMLMISPHNYVNCAAPEVAGLEFPPFPRQHRALDKKLVTTLRHSASSVNPPGMYLPRNSFRPHPYRPALCSA